MDKIEAIIFLVDEGVNDFLSSIPAVDRKVYARLLDLVSSLERDRLGGIKNNAANLIQLGKIRREIEQLLMSKEYLRKVKDFVSIYDKIQVLNNEYFETISEKFTPKKLYDQIVKLNVETTVERLTEKGIGAAYAQTIKNILKTNVTAGSNYLNMTEQLRAAIIGKEGEDSTLLRYAKQITIDSVNQYNANYIKAVSDDLGYNWFAYRGALKTTSREFCKVLAKRGYFHRSEIPGFLEGRVGGKEVELSDSTGLPKGMIDGTNEVTFFENRGGYLCGHQIYPVSEKNVPKEIRDQVATA